MTQQELFKKLIDLNVNDKAEKKGKFTYLSWCWAWARFKEACPDAVYEIVKQPSGLPYICDPETGYMVFTKITAAGVTHEMWLPVLDYNNKPLKPGAADMYAINKAIMRCLVKNMAMFGLGLYIYAGEDLPEAEDGPEHCTACGGEIKPFKGKDGKVLSPHEFAEKTGGVCVTCYKKMQLADAREQTGVKA